MQQGGAEPVSYTHLGDLMVIDDHINFMGANPLTGPNDAGFGPRFCDMTYAYTPALRRLADEVAAAQGVALRHGVYLGYMGPSYETPAEIRAFRVLGADAVGMSTVPEVIAASHCGLPVLAISLVTNMAAGVLEKKLDENEVIETAAARAKVLERLVTVSYTHLHDHVGMARGKHVQQAAAVYGRIRRSGGCVHGRAFLLLDLCQHRIYFIRCV